MKGKLFRFCERLFWDQVFIARLTTSASSITVDQCPSFLFFTVPSLLLLIPYAFSFLTVTLKAIGAAAPGKVGNGRGE